MLECIVEHGGEASHKRKVMSNQFLDALGEGVLWILGLGDKVEYISVNLFKIDCDVLCPVKPSEESGGDTCVPDENLGDLLGKGASAVSKDRAHGTFKCHSLEHWEFSLGHLFLDALIEFISNFLLLGLHIFLILFIIII